MNTRTAESKLTTKRSRNTSWLWMIFSTIWVGTLIGSAITYYRLPGERATDPSIALGLRMAAILLVAAFVCIYSYTVYRMYFNRTSWLVVYGNQERWWIRGSLTIIAIAMNFLPDGDRADWQSAFVFVAIAWALTSIHYQAIASVFQVALIAAVTLAVTDRGDVIPGTMLYVTGFGTMIAGYVINNGTIGEMAVARGRDRDRTVTEERFRLARDLHDTVGHSMTQITLKAELARKLIDSDPDRAVSELSDIESLSRGLSAQVRESIAGEVELTFGQEIDRATAMLDSMDISLEKQIETGLLPSHVDAALAWCTREGVMNVIKHSGASRCHIQLKRFDSDLVLTITDNGSNPDRASTGGQGIVGMKSRLQSMGGNVMFTSTEVGHTLEMRIPV